MNCGRETWNQCHHDHHTHSDQKFIILYLFNLYTAHPLSVVLHGFRVMVIIRLGVRVRVRPRVEVRVSVRLVQCVYISPVMSTHLSISNTLSVSSGALTMPAVCCWPGTPVGSCSWTYIADPAGSWWWSAVPGCRCSPKYSQFVPATCCHRR